MLSSFKSRCKYSFLCIDSKDSITLRNIVAKKLSFTTCFSLILLVIIVNRSLPSKKSITITGYPSLRNFRVFPGTSYSYSNSQNITKIHYKQSLVALTQAQSHTHTLSHTHTHSLSLSLTHTHTHTHAYTHSHIHHHHHHHPHSLTHSLTHTLTHIPPLTHLAPPWCQQTPLSVAPLPQPPPAAACKRPEHERESERVSEYVNE
jgi:hypothetical protein